MIKNEFDLLSFVKHKIKLVSWRPMHVETTKKGAFRGIIQWCKGHE